MRLLIVPLAAPNFIVNCGANSLEVCHQRAVDRIYREQTGKSIDSLENVTVSTAHRAGAVSFVIARTNEEYLSDVFLMSRLLP